MANVDLLRSSRHFENRDHLRYAPYPQTHCQRAESSIGQQFPPLFNHNQGIFMTEQYWSCFHFDGRQRRRYTPIPTSPISSASSKSPAPIEDCEKDSESLQCNESIPKEVEEYGNSNCFLPNENISSTSSVLSNDSNAVYHSSDSLNTESSDTIGILWRPWGITS